MVLSRLEETRYTARKKAREAQTAGVENQVGDAECMIARRPERADDAVHVVQSADEFSHAPLADQAILGVKRGCETHIASRDDGTHVGKTANNSHSLRVGEKERIHLVMSIDDVEEVSTADTPHISMLNKMKRDHSFPEKLPPNKKAPSLEAQRHVI